MKHHRHRPKRDRRPRDIESPPLPPSLEAAFEEVEGAMPRYTDAMPERTETRAVAPRTDNESVLTETR